jgi:hypothetical protein
VTFASRANAQRAPTWTIAFIFLAAGRPADDRILGNEADRSGNDTVFECYSMAMGIALSTKAVERTNHGTARISEIRLGASRRTRPRKPCHRSIESRLKWRMTSSFTRRLDITYGAAELFCKYVSDLTEGRFQIQQFGGR